MNIKPCPYNTARDLIRMKDLLMAGRQAGPPAYYVHVGDLDWWLHYLNQEDDRRHVINLWQGDRPDDQLIGWSLFSPRFRAFDVFVHPDQLGSEWAEQIWIWAAERMGEIVRAQGGETVRTMWISEHDAALITLLKRRGFTRGDNHLVYSVRSLDEPIPPPALPPGYSVRSVAGEHEAAQRAAVTHAAFASSQPLEQYQARYLAFMRSPAYTPELDLVVVAPHGGFGAFCICWLDHTNKVGLLEPVGTAPAFRRTGLGKAVVYAGLGRMQAWGMASAMVCVAHNNPAAGRLYAAVGFRALHRILTYAKDV